MNDSNVEVPKAEAQPAPQKPRSYTERFMDLEETVNKLIYTSNFHTNTIMDMVERFESVMEQLKILNTVRNTLTAMLKLSEEGIPATLDNVAKKVMKLQAEDQRNRIKDDVDAKVLLPIDAIKDDNTVIAFESLPELEYSHGTLSSFKGETKDGLVGKKVGDVVGNVTILGIYEVNESKEGQTNEPTGQEKSGEQKEN